MTKKRFKALEITQRGFSFYLTSMNISDLYRICQKDVNKFNDDDLVYQRELNKTRVNKIASYVRNGRGLMPTAIVLNAKQEIMFNGDDITIDLDKDSFFIVDGQHRIYGAHMAGIDYELCVVIMNKLDLDYQSELFLTINNEQKTVNSNVRFNMMGHDSVKTPERVIRNIAKVLNDDVDSPFFGMIRMDDRPKPKSKNMISLSTFAQPIVSYIYNPSDHYRLKMILERNGCYESINNGAIFDYEYRINDSKILWPLYSENKEIALCKILNNYFKAVRHTFKKQWANSDYILSKTTGYNALIVLFKDVFRFCRITNDFRTSVFVKLLESTSELAETFTMENCNLGKAGAYDLYMRMRRRINFDGTILSNDLGVFEYLVDDDLEEEKETQLFLF